MGFAIAEAKLPTDENVAKLFYECKDFVVASCQGEAWFEKIDDIWQVIFFPKLLCSRPNLIMVSFFGKLDINYLTFCSIDVKKFHL